MARKQRDRSTDVSKFISYHLRHNPDAIGLELAPGGWVRVEALLLGAERSGFPFSREELARVVETSDKKRFSFDATGQLIRANHGHSVPVDLQLEPAKPPAILYHGTATHSVASILQDGLEKRSRVYVHLSIDVPTARSVGSRHGSPVILRIDAGTMHDAGHVFFCSTSGVWLVEDVPAQYLRVVD